MRPGECAFHPLERARWRGIYECRAGGARPSALWAYPILRVWPRSIWGVNDPWPSYEEAAHACHSSRHMCPSVSVS